MHIGRTVATTLTTLGLALFTSPATAGDAGQVVFLDPSFDKPKGAEGPEFATEWMPRGTCIPKLKPGVPPGFALFGGAVLVSNDDSLRREQLFGLGTPADQNAKVVTLPGDPRTIQLCAPANSAPRFQFGSGDSDIARVTKSTFVHTSTRKAQPSVRKQ